MKKEKSLRQLARELGVSVSYLSQIKNGRRPASQKVLSIIKQNEVHFLNPIQVRYTPTGFLSRSENISITCFQ